MIKKADELASGICDIESDCLGEKKDRKRKAMDAEGHRKKKHEQKLIRDDDGRG